MIAKLSQVCIEDRDHGYKVTPVSMDMSFSPATFTTVQSRWGDAFTKCVFFSSEVMKCERLEGV